MIRVTQLTGPGLDDLLTKTFFAYRQGLLRQAQPPLPVPARNLNMLSFLGALGWARPLDRLRLRNLYHASGEGLSASRRGDVDSALEAFQRAEETLDLLETGSPAWHLGVSGYEAAVADLDFRQGFSDRARERLDRVMDADLELENRGLPVRQIHRIQQGHNLSRIHRRLGRGETALELCGVLIAYTAGCVGTLPFHRDWRPRALQAVPRNLRQMMIHEILGDAAGFIVTGNAAAKEWGDFIAASHLAQKPLGACFPQAQLVLRAQASRLADDPAGYLQSLERFFRFGIRDCFVLWYLLIIEWMDFCFEMNTPRAREIHSAILRDSAKWVQLPPFLRARLPVLPQAQRSVA